VLLEKLDPTSRSEFVRVVVEVGVSGSKTTSKSRTETGATKFTKAPEFPETEAARGEWWNRLQQFGGEPGYGAIAPDWADIWENAQRKVRQYFWGSPTDPGIIGKVRASAAGRGVSESPALEKMIGRMGATESNVISDMATQQAQQQSQFGEAGRLNYMQQLQSLAGYKPEVAGYTPWQTTDTAQKTNAWDVRAKAGVMV